MRGGEAIARTVRTVAGWVAFGASLLLLLGIAVSSMAAATGLVDEAGSAGWMGPGMMGSGQMGPGMMGFGASGPAATAIPNAAEVQVQASNFSFAPSEIRLPAGTGVNLTLSNPASTGVAHDLTVRALGIHIVASAGATQTVGLRGLAAGRYDAYCSVPGHADLGMRATVVVE